MAETARNSAFILLYWGFRQSDDSLLCDALLCSSALCSTDDCPTLRTNQEQEGIDSLSIALSFDSLLQPTPSRLCLFPIR